MDSANKKVFDEGLKKLHVRLERLVSEFAN